MRQVFLHVASTGWVAALYAASLQPHTLRAPMKSADSLLICRTSFALKLSFRLCEFRSDLSCHHAQLPAQPFDVILQAPIFYVALVIKPVVQQSALGCTACHSRELPRLFGPSCWQVQR